MKRIFIILSAICSLIININCSSSKKLDPVTEAYRKSACSKYKRNDYNGAIAICKEAIAKNPQNDVAYSIMGSSYWGLKDYNNAYLSYNQALIIKPTDNELRYNRACTETMLKKYKEAIEDYSYTIKKGYDKANSYYSRGWVEGSIYKQYDAAMKDYDSCLKMDPQGHSFVYQYKAFIYEYQYKYDSATLELQECIKKDLEQIKTTLHSMNISKKSFDYKRNNYLKDSSFIKAYSSTCDAYGVLGGIYMGLGKYSWADSYYELGKQYSLPKANCFSGKSKLELKNLHYSLALENIDSAIAYNPQNNCYYAERGYILKEKKDYNGAMSCFEKAINCDCAKVDGYMFRGETELAMGNYQKAIEDVTSSINASVDSSNYVALNLRGYAYFKNKQYKEALADYDTAIKQAKSNYQPYWEYRQEALDALNGTGTNACTIILWQSPADDANSLYDSAKYHTSYGEPLKINLKVIINHPITKDAVVTSVNGTHFIGDAKLTLKENDATTKQYIYEFEETLKLPLGAHPLQIECDNKHSQTINMVVE